MQKKQPHFVSASWRAKHTGKQEASKPCRKNSPILLALVGVLNILENKKPASHAEPNSPILLALVGVLNILENKKPASHAEKTAPFC